MLKGKILLTTSRDLASYTKQELKHLGYTKVNQTPGGLSLDGNFSDLLRLNLHLRTCHHVLLLLKEFQCREPNDLYRSIKAFPWEKIIDANGYLSIFSNISTPSINNSQFANLKCKDAIVDRIAEKQGKRPDSGANKDQIVIYLYWKDDYCAVYLDSSGETLARRNYRKFHLKAPMQETLAAGLIMATNWPATTHFINPMCGSGTLAIEAALIALNRAPAIKRNNFSFMHVHGFNQTDWDKLRRQAQEKEIKPKIKIIASDIDPKAIETAEKNALAAGVHNLIEFKVCDFKDTPIPENKGIIILNPEYGVRSGTITELEPLYKSIGDFFKHKCAGYTGYVFSGSFELLKKIGLKPNRKIPFHNANLECRLNEYLLYSGSKDK